VDSPRPAARERNWLEAWLHGWSVICCVIAATMVVVSGLVALCGGPVAPEALLYVAGTVAAAAILHGYSRLARTPS
jgi:hypothetical protein